MKSATGPEWTEKLVALKVIKGKSHKQIFHRIKTSLENAKLVTQKLGLFTPAAPDSDAAE
jgi:hypothetical protein